MSRTKPVSELMRTDLITIEKGETVEIALDFMERNDINHLIVTSDGKLVGVLSVRDIMEGLGSSRFQRVPARRIYVSALMMEPPVTIKETSLIKEAITILLENNIRSLPVMRGDSLVGIVTETDLIRELESEESIKDLVKVDHPKIMPNERIVHARSIMLERGARMLPVVESSGLVGIVTERNLAKAFLDVRENIDPVYMDNVVRRIVVEDVMIEAPRKLAGYISINEAKRNFIETKLPALPVIEPHGERLVGVLERRSLLRLFR